MTVFWQEINLSCHFGHCGRNRDHGIVPAMGFYIALTALVVLAILAGFFGVDSRPTDERHNWAH
jgi:hypothetical protein